jgi:hypothetical protein
VADKKRFEAWAKTVGLSLLPVRDTYRAPETVMAWLAWEAAYQEGYDWGCEVTMPYYECDCRR